MVFVAAVTGGARPIDSVWTSDIEGRLDARTLFVNPRGEARISNVFRQPGRHVVTCDVTDALGRTNSDLVVINVDDTPSFIDITSPLEDAQFANNETVPLRGVSRDPDTSRRLADGAVSWRLEGQNAFGPSGHEAEIPANTLSEGEHRVQFQAFERDRFIRSDWRVFTIGVATTTPRPNLIIASPIDGAHIYPNERDASDMSTFLRLYPFLGELSMPMAESCREVALHGP